MKMKMKMKMKEEAGKWRSERRLSKLKTTPEWPPEEWFTENEKKKKENEKDKEKDTKTFTQQPRLFSTIIQSSPSTTQSINPTTTTTTTTNQTTPHPTSLSIPQTQLSSSSSSIQTSIHSHTSFRPPPLHPSILARQNGGVIPVKETMDAHSSFSERGQKQVNQYLIKNEIGRGSFGAVHLAEDAETGLSYAIKEFSKTRLTRKFAKELKHINRSFDQTNDGLYLIRNEVAIMKKLRHQNVVRLHEVLDVVGEDSLYMVMEYCPGGSLMQLVKEAHQETQASFRSGLDIDAIRRYFRQLIVGIDYLHRNEIIHYDIKPDNILLSSDKKQIKVADFGISAMFTRPGDDSTVTRTIGSPAFLSPELVKSEPDAAVSGTATDIWAMGVTLYFMLTARLPFPSEQMMEMYEAIEYEAPPIPDEWEPPLVDLMSGLFAKDPHERVKMAELKGHGWVTQEGKLPTLGAAEPAPPAHITEHDLRHCFRFGITNHCPLTRNLFFELVDNSRKHSADPALPHRASRREIFFREFHRQISERNKV